MGDTLVDPDARSNTRQELLQRAGELGIVGRWRLKKADLADAIARKEAMRAVAQQELQSVEQQVREKVWAAAREEYRAAAQEVRREIQSLTQSAKQSVQGAMRAAGEQELQSFERRLQEVAQAAEQRVQEAAPAGAEDLAQAIVQSGRAARGRRSLGFRSLVRQAWVGFGWVIARLRGPVLTVLLAVVAAMATATLASDYYTSRIGDWAFRRGALPVSTEVTLERESRAQGLTWVFREGLNLDELGVHARLVLGQAATSPTEFNDWARRRRRYRCRRLLH